MDDKRNVRVFADLSGLGSAVAWLEASERVEYKNSNGWVEVGRWEIEIEEECSWTLIMCAVTTFNMVE